MKMIYYFIQNGYKEDKHYEMQRNIRTIKKYGAVEVWTNGIWSVGLEVWDNGALHIYASNDCICANGIMYSNIDRVIWDWTPFPNYVRLVANQKRIHKAYRKFRGEE